MRMAGRGRGRKRKSSRPPPRKPHFFKVLVGDFTQRLRIPPKFLKHISNEASKRAILQGPNGKSWHVELGKDIKGTFLLCGWPNFVRDNSLREHEFLVFRYDGNMHFSVMIFDTSACEREDVLTTKVCLLSEGIDRPSRPVKHFRDAGCLLQQNTRSKLSKLPSTDMHLPNQLKDDSSNAIQGRCILSSNSNEHAKIKIEDDATQLCMLISDTKCTKGYFSRKWPMTEQERLKALEAINSFSSIFPYFISCMTRSKISKKHMLALPSRFSREHLPQRTTNLVLRDPCGKAWVVVYKLGERDHLSTGWTSFVRGNDLKEGDICVFELVGPMELRLSIIHRVVEDTTPLI